MLGRSLAGGSGRRSPGRGPGCGCSASAFASCYPLRRPPPCTVQRTDSFTFVPDQCGQAKGPFLPHTRPKNCTRDLRVCGAALPGCPHDLIPTAKLRSGGLVSCPPQSQLHQWVHTRASVGTATLEGIRERLSGERQGPGDCRDAGDGRGGAQCAGSRGKEGSSRCGCGTRAPPPTAALLPR